jgi:hypothetical protein
VRPDPSQLLQSLRVSLAETVVPAIEDRWARYAAAAMDLVLQHLQLRLAGELGAVTADNADMAQTLATIATDVAAAAEGSPGAYAQISSAFRSLPAPQPAADLTAGDLAAVTATNERLRADVVALLHALDAAEPDPRIEAWRDEVLRLVRRQVDRINPMVAPLYMSFSPMGTP